MLRAAVLAAALALLAVATGCNFFFPEAGETDSDGQDSGDDGAAKFIAVGDGGTIVRSAFGQEWTVSTSGVTVALHDVTYGAEMYIAVGQAGAILYSFDGAEWDKASSPSSRDLFAVRFHGGRFIAVGGDYSVGAETLESTDGITWTRPDLPAPKHLLYDLASDNVTLVALGSYQADAMATGAFTWQEGAGWIQRLDGAASGVRYTALAHGAPNFALIGPTNTATSSDGIAWQNTPLFSLSLDPRALTYGPGAWVTVGGAGQIAASSGAITWLPQASPFMLDLLDVAASNQRYVAVGVAGQIAHSSDGLTWTSVTPPVSADLRAVAHTRQ